MPSKKKKYNARFPAGRIKRIMQSDEEVGKVAQAVPVIIYILFRKLKQTLELFVESLLTKTLKITNSRNAKTLSTSHMKQCIMSEQRFDFLRELVRNIPDISVAEEAANYNEEDNQRADCVPAKLARSDSTPVPQHITSIPAPVQLQQHSRLKHQSYSMPTTTTTTPTIDNNCNIPNINNPPTQLRSHKQQTAIPAPIVSIDYCNKPVVKIDYSNLPLAEISSSSDNTIATPLSAPANIANISNNNSTFNFSAEPVINIDLSNIVNASTGATTVSSIPSVATISIGTPTLKPPPSNNSSKSTLALTASINHNNNKTRATANAVTDQQSRNSKVAVAQPLSSSSSSASLTAKANALATAVAAATMTTATTKSSDSYLEMDEDYDNI
ncbi:hypothetical protein DOY81_002689 [Sarcophaga bullata]|nr:hypothetical protein DOY81_002689 [Sarcophaga bullata]